MHNIAELDLDTGRVEYYEASYNSIAEALQGFASSLSGERLRNQTAVTTEVAMGDLILSY